MRFFVALFLSFHPLHFGVKSCNILQVVV